jgi:hypothetical protein
MRSPLPRAARARARPCRSWASGIRRRGPPLCSSSRPRDSASSRRIASCGMRASASGCVSEWLATSWPSATMRASIGACAVASRATTKNVARTPQRPKQSSRPRQRRGVDERIGRERAVAVADQVQVDRIDVHAHSRNGLCHHAPPTMGRSGAAGARYTVWLRRGGSRHRPGREAISAVASPPRRRLICARRHGRCCSVQGTNRGESGPSSAGINKWLRAPDNPLKRQAETAGRSGAG